MLYSFITRQVRRLREICSQVLALPDSPKKIAQGVALGTALEFLPLPFISIPVSFILAKLFRINAVAAVLTVIFFKWAVPVFFYFDFFVGKLIIGGRFHSGHIMHGVRFTGLRAWTAWFKSLGYPFLVGSAVNSVVAGIIVYFVVKALLDYYRRKKKSRFVKLPHPGKIH